MEPKPRRIQWRVVNRRAAARAGWHRACVARVCANARDLGARTGDLCRPTRLPVQRILLRCTLPLVVRAADVRAGQRAFEFFRSRRSRRGSRRCAATCLVARRTLDPLGDGLFAPLRSDVRRRRSAAAVHVRIPDSWRIRGSVAMISAMVFLPALAALLLLLVPKSSTSILKAIALLASVATFIISLSFLGVAPNGIAQDSMAWISGAVAAAYHVRVDGISLFFVLLTTVIAVPAMWAAFSYADV